MNKDGMQKWIERLREELSEAIDKCTSLTDPCVIEKSIRLDRALNSYNSFLFKLSERKHSKTH